MTFVSFNFYIFLAVAVILYYVLPLKFRWYVLLAGSIFFYLCVSEFSIAKLGIILGTALVSWVFSILQTKAEKQKTLWLVLSIVITAVPFLLIKELPFINSQLYREDPVWLIVPVGIAFYSLQLISYSVDVYKGKIQAEKNPLKFILFATFFPQIIQGPIPRYEQLAPQLTAGHKFDEQKFMNGFMLILWGFFLKLCIADKAGVFVNNVFDNYPAYKGTFALIAGILYSLQLYADFLACTSLAQGIAGLFGIELTHNFKRPYLASSVKDFWRRWHISLSTWLKDYIYIPLGGNRKGKALKYLFLVITFAVSGIWHGSGYKFIVWGLMHAGYEIIGELLSPVNNFLNKLFRMDKHVIFHRVIKAIWTFILITFAWIIFRADTLSSGFGMIKSIFTTRNPWVLSGDIFGLGLDIKEFIVLALCLLVLLAVGICQEKGIHFRDKILSFNIVARWVIFIAVIVFVVIFGTYGYGFDAQAFIYGGF